MAEKKIVKLTRVAKYSYAVVVPKELIDKYGWKERQKLTFEDKGRGRLELKDWRKN